MYLQEMIGDRWHCGCFLIQMYWLGPLLAGVVAALLYDLVFAANASVEKAKAFFTRKDYDDRKFDETPQSSGDAWT